MDKLDIILWIISGGFSLMLIMWHSMNSRFEKIESELKEMREHDSRTDVRLAVIETRLNDVSTNVVHLMWQHQSPRDAQEQ